MLLLMTNVSIKIHNFSTCYLYLFIIGRSNSGHRFCIVTELLVEERGRASHDQKRLRKSEWKLLKKERKEDAVAVLSGGLLQVFLPLQSPCQPMRRGGFALAPKET
ncbi:hypothetical protein GOODEAATRI_014856 [Goodea atripinnis]|uniref:Uncharacterized protein n=1 Tax=Goodea atripinnis TaxID=208336 RepID=A0ABV0NB24_9TELE